MLHHLHQLLPIPFIKLCMLAISITGMAFIIPVDPSHARSDNSLDVLRKEVTNLVRNKSAQWPETIDQVLTVGFLINARNEIIVLDVDGDSASLCAYVKQVLNYNKVKYNQVRQLTRYSIKIHLVNKKY